MICYDKYGKMTQEFQAYQQEAWEKVRILAEELTAKAIQDGVCPQALRNTMQAAVDCGSLLASQQAYVDDHTKVPESASTQTIDYKVYQERRKPLLRRYRSF